MGCAKSKDARSTYQYPYPPKANLELNAWLLVLTPRDSPNAIRFKSSQLQNPMPSPLVLESHPGLALVATESVFGPYDGKWMILPIGIGDSKNALYGRYDGEFLTYHGEDEGKAKKVLDISYWKYEEGNGCNFVGHKRSLQQTFLRNGGRSFRLNTDGTLTVTEAPQFVLGIGFPDCTLVSKGNSDNVFVLDSEVMYALREGKEVDMTGSITTMNGQSQVMIVSKTTAIRHIPEFQISYQDLGFAPRQVSSSSPSSSEDRGVVAMKMKKEGDFLVSCSPSSLNFALDVPFGVMREHCEGDMGKLPLVVLNEEGGTNLDTNNKARLFKINENGTISPMSAEHLVVGIRGALFEADGGSNLSGNEPVLSTSEFMEHEWSNSPSV